VNNAKTTAECPGFQLARDLRTGNHQKVKHASGWAEAPGCDSHQRCARCRGPFAVAFAGPFARRLPPCGWKCERIGGNTHLRLAPKVRALARPSAATFTAPFARGDASLLEHLHPAGLSCGVDSNSQHAVFFTPFRNVSDMCLPFLVLGWTHRYNDRPRPGSCLLFHGVFDDDAERHLTDSA
jgi:hypothetical protein